MIAEIKGKLTNTKIKRSEDELTGNFFGNMRYFSFNSGLKQILKNGIYPAGLSEAFNCINAEDWADRIAFWPREKGAEPDVLLDFENITIIIEVKYYSGLSSDDDIDISQVDDEQKIRRSGNRLAREARLLKRIAGDKKKLLILLAPESSAHQIYTDTNGGNLLEGVTFGYITWQKVYDALQKISGSNPYERVILNDLLALLRKKGFESFKNFEISCKEVDADELWSFYNFSFIIKNHVERSKFYEFR
jgi:hypothetical protein